MEELILNVELRDGAGRSKAKDLRNTGFVPSVIYGEGKKALSIKVITSELIKLVHKYRVENTLINLKFKNDKDKKAKVCLIKEMQYHPVHGNVIHVDFNEISMSKVIKINIPVVAKGEAVGVKQDGGSLEHVLWEIEVECLPTQIPEEIAVDVSLLKIGDAIHIKDIKFPSGVEVLNDAGAVVLHVAAPMKEEVPAEAVEGEEKKEPEVIKEKKEAPAEASEKEEGKEKK